MSARKRAIQDLGEEELDRKYVQGYLKKPEDPAFGEAGMKLAAMVWPVEDWTDWESPRAQAPPKRRR
jgi:hypothetical protein